MRTRRRRSRTGWLSAAAAIVAAVVVAAVGALRLAPPDLPLAAAGQEQADVRKARQLLERVSVKGRAAKTGYERDRFGSGWATVRGCDIRNRVLARDMVDVSYKPGTRSCVVAAGTLHDPYSGRTIPFTKGERTSTLVQVDHRYPLALAWQQGAQTWDDRRRESFSNDLDNLQATSGRTNQAKGASGPGSWLPPHRPYRCRYVVEFVEVAAEWGLSMNPGDHAMSERVLARCAQS